MVRIYGRTITVVPFQMPQTSYRWRDVRDYLPSEITADTQEPMSYKAIYYAVRNLVVVTGASYEDALREVTQTYIAENPDDPRPYEMVKLYFSDAFLSSSGREHSEKAAHAHNQYLATLYLHDMLKESFGYGAIKF